MKTIKEAAQSNEENPVILTQGYKLTAYISFQAGVKFAQRWISVEDEEPKHAQKVLMKTQSGYVEGGYYDYATFRHNDDRLCYGITHWRPIELE
ncbi:MAG: DUF551 domain-containing protein [Prevotellaceae bacterium]|jgi:hypothetical protein|nr:DUF551 domain-containing protein [Prevotellaceae bacterium]